MVKPSTRPRKKPADDGSLNALFTGAADPALDTDLQAEAAKDKADDPTAPLLAQISALASRVDELVKNNSAAMVSTSAAPILGKEPTLDLSGLPDPQYDNDAFVKGVAQRTQDHVKATMAYQQTVADASRQASQSQTSKAESLWEDFQSKFPDHAAGNDKLVLFASQQVADAAKARGLDVERYMFNNRGQFMQEVASTMDSIRGVPFSKEQEQEEQEEQEEAATRTAGVFGNGTSIPRPGPDNKALAGDMIADIRDMQKKSGFF